MPDRPLPNKIRFKKLRINFIDHSVIEFLRSNKQIWDRNGTNLEWFCRNGQNATAGQALSKWLHTPSKNGQPKRLFCEDLDEEGNIDWVNSFKEAFARATNSSVSYKILFSMYKTSIEPFESVNERAEEKLTLDKVPPRSAAYWLLKRCPIIVGETADVWWENDEFWDDNLNNVQFNLCGDINESIGLLSPPAEKADE